MNVHSRNPIARRTVGLAAALMALCQLGSAGCRHAESFAVVPSLQPVDAARPYVRFGPIEGRACGSAAVADALADMKRLAVDGYLEVVIEVSGRGDNRCAAVRGYPFRYGTDLTTPVLVDDEPLDPVLVPGREAVPGDGEIDCEAACRRAIGLLSMDGDIARELAIDDCIQRCGGPDAAFADCIDAAQAPAQVEACLGTEEEHP